MILGSLVDLGVSVKEIQRQLSSLDLKGYRLRSRREKRGSIVGTKVDVQIDKSPKVKPPSRYFSKISNLIESSNLSEAVKKHSIAVFKRLAKAEAKVHRTTIQKIHFHEVGAIDSIVDIVGGVVALDLLGVDRIHCSSLNTGEGQVVCEHGTLPVPAPATLELLQGIPCYSSGIKKELTTPTGAAMIGHFVDEFGSLPPLKIIKTGYGAGGHRIPELPNFLRVILGESVDVETPTSLEIIETNIDDMNPEFYELIMDRLFEAGAVDVYLTPIQMKKNRPATKLSVLVHALKRDEVIQILLKETSTFGVRYFSAKRQVLDRSIKRMKSPWGMVRVKLGQWEQKAMRVSPEYDDCRIIAQKENLPIKKVYEEVLKLAKEKYKI